MSKAAHSVGYWADLTAYQMADQSAVWWVVEKGKTKAGNLAG